jgi:beta-lactam-binding protein with PASTA domain
VPLVNRALLALKRILIVVGIAIAFSIGLIGAIVLSLRSSETKVPDIVGKDRTAAESTISSAGLNFRVRAMRSSSEAKPDTVLIQVPSAGVIVKVGQTVAVDISRSSKEGETSTTTSDTNTATEKKSENTNTSNSNANSNDNKPKKKPANANGNSNANANGNRNANRIANQNRAANANRATSENANAGETPAHNVNANRGNLNTNRRPPVAAPTPQF